MIRPCFVRALLFAICSLAPSVAAPLELISKPYEERPNSFGDSGPLALSADGKWAVFSSTGNGLVTNDANGFNLDVFLRDLDSGTTTLISKNTNGISGNGHSVGATISPDGRWVLYETEADNLAPDDDNESSDVILYDRTSGLFSAIRPSTGFAEGASGAASMTADGRFILFETEAMGFSPLDQNDSADLYLLERETGAFHLVNIKSNNTATAATSFPSQIGSFEGTVSADGRYVAFISSGTNHVPGVGGNTVAQIYLRDTVNRTNAWLSRNTNGAASTSVASPMMSTNGALVAFLSAKLEGANTPGAQATVLYLHDTATGTRRTAVAGSVDEFALSENGQYIAYGASNQIYLLDIAAQTTRLVSGTSAGAPGTSVSGAPQISSDGRYVVFTSVSTNLATNVTDEFFQTYRFDRQSGEVLLLSRATHGAGGANAETLFPVISGDGSKAGFMSYASNLVEKDNALANDVFVVSTTGADPVTLVSAPHPGAVLSTAAGMSLLEGQALSVDGRRLTFTSHASDIVRHDTNASRDIFQRDLVTGLTRVISGDPSGKPNPGAATLVGASLDGNIIAFTDRTIIDGTSKTTLHYHNVTTGSNTPAGLLPTGIPAANISEAILSPDGRYLAFRETDTSPTLYVRDLENQATVSRLISGVGRPQPLAFSPGNRYLLARSTSTLSIFEWQSNRVVTNLTFQSIPANPISFDESKLLVELRAPTPPGFDLTLYSLDGATTNQVIATNTSFFALSADGSTVVYQTRSVTPNAFNLYTHYVASGLATPLMLGGTNVDLRLRAAPSISADGRFIAFASTNAFATGGDENGFMDVFVYDRILKTVRLVSQNLEGGGGDFGSGSPNISADVRVVAFDSAATDLVANDGNLSTDIFVARLDAIDTDVDGLEDGWETIHFGGLTGMPDADTDNDGVSNRQESLAGTNPNSATSKFAVVTEIGDAPDRIILTSSAAIGRAYQLQHRASLAAGDWQNVGQKIVALSNEVRFETLMNAQGNGFFRIQTP